MSNEELRLGKSQYNADKRAALRAEDEIIDRARRRYYHDAEFHALVETAVSIAHADTYAPGTVRLAISVALIMAEDGG